MAEKVTKIVDQIKELTVVEAFELKKALEEEFGVTAAAPMMMGAMPMAGAAPAEEVEEKTEFDVFLNEVGADKINIIKIVKEVTGLGLKEAKDMTEATPAKVAEAVSKDKATEIVKKLTDAGAKAEMK